MSIDKPVEITIEITKEELDALVDLSLPTAPVVALTDRIHDEYWETIEWQKAEQRMAQRAEDDQ
tara:strand:+ start:481 stop:672 length:192 start_codon:yes stop_codon:yes gene_type:complete